MEDKEKKSRLKKIKTFSDNYYGSITDDNGNIVSLMVKFDLYPTIQDEQLENVFKFENIDDLREFLLESEITNDCEALIYNVKEKLKDFYTDIESEFKLVIELH